MSYRKAVRQHKLRIRDHRVRVFYWKGIGDPASLPKTKTELTNDYVEVGTVTVQRNQTQPLDSVWSMYNTDEVNPLANDSGQRFLRDHGLKHTSMSVGDVIELNGVAYAATSEGFEKLPFRIR